VNEQPRENTTVLVRNGAAVQVVDDAYDVDLGNVAIMPGLVNAHTHLEFSTLGEPLSLEDSTSFADWIRALLEWRLQREAAAPSAHAAAIAQGLGESKQRGTTLLGEIATQPSWPDCYQVAKLGGVRFLELMGLSDDRINDVLERAHTYVSPPIQMPTGWRAGLSPHAPYTVGWSLVKRVVEISRQFRAPLAMHLAETCDEMQLLAAHSGPLVEFLSERGVWDPAAVPRGIEPLAYLEVLSQAHRALVIHGNYLQRPDWELLAQHRERMSVVYCPRTFAYFGHRRYPLEEMLRHRVHVAVGTDSRASNPDLDLFDELKFLHQQHPEVDLGMILRLGTQHGAEALGCAKTPRQMTVVALPDADSPDPYELLFSAESQVT
jgi:cytosine/adenosine deaminase-related metal-dependent hydrolase